MQFLNPGLVAGALLFAVPLIIHLLNRQRHKRRDWAAMEFLLRAYQKTRNRLRNENLLLLLLRCLVPIALALAIARPILQSGAALVAAGSATHHVVVLDASYSMGLQQDSGPSPFERGRTMVTRLLEQLQQKTDANDKVTLVAAGVRPRFLAREETNLGVAKALWQELSRPDDSAGDLLPAMMQAAAALDEGPPGPASFYVLSDLQTRAFGKALEAPSAEAAAPEFRDTLQDAFDRLRAREGTTVQLIDVGPLAEQRAGGVRDNAQITGLYCDQPVAIARQPMPIVASLCNRSERPLSLQVTLDVDGAEPMRKEVALDAGATGEAEFLVTFREPGRRRLRAALQADGLDADDARYLSLHVRDRISVLVVDGAAEDDPLKSYGWFYRGMLDPAGLSGQTALQGTAGALSTFDVTVIDTLALLSGQRDPADFDVVILSDVDRLNERSATAIESALQAGKGLLCALGRRVDAANYALQLHQNGEGPMPMRLGARMGGPAGSSTPRNCRIALPDHPALREFDEDLYREILQAAPVYEWFGTAAGTLRDDAQVALRLSDPDQSPLLVLSSHGEGRVAFLTSALGSEYDGDRWNRLDDSFIVFPLLHGLVQRLSLPAQDLFALEVGGTITGSLPARAIDAEVLLPERAGARKLPLLDDSRALFGGRFTLPAFADTAMAGFYTVDLRLDRQSGQEPWSAPYAVNVDPAEGLLRYAAHQDVQQALGLEAVLTAMPQDQEAGSDALDQEIGPSLLLLTLLLVLSEAAMARYVSARRS